MNKTDFTQYISDGLLYSIKYGRGAVIVAYDQDNISISDLVHDIHGTDGTTGLNPVTKLGFTDDFIEVEVSHEYFCWKTSESKNWLVTKLMPNSQVSFELYL
jgi:hypothetical protein